MRERSILIEAASIAEADQHIQSYLHGEATYLLAEEVLDAGPSPVRVRITIVQLTPGDLEQRRASPLASADYLSYLAARPEPPGLAPARQELLQVIGPALDLVLTTLKAQFDETEASEELNGPQRQMVFAFMERGIRRGADVYLSVALLNQTPIAAGERSTAAISRVQCLLNTPGDSLLHRYLQARHDVGPAIDTLGERAYWNLAHEEPSIARIFYPSVRREIAQYLRSCVRMAYLACLIVCEPV